MRTALVLFTLLAPPQPRTIGCGAGMEVRSADRMVVSLSPVEWVDDAAEVGTVVQWGVEYRGRSGARPVIPANAGIQGSSPAPAEPLSPGVRRGDGGAGDGGLAHAPSYRRTPVSSGQPAPAEPLCPGVRRGDGGAG